MIAEAMPTITKILFLAVALGLVSPLLYNVWKAGQRPKPPRRRQDPYKPREVTEARLRKMWVIDRDHWEPTADPRRPDRNRQ